MPTLPVHVSTLPLFTNARARCGKCGARYEIRVHYDRGCAEVTGGEHFHRICNCGHRRNAPRQPEAVDCGRALATIGTLAANDWNHAKIKVGRYNT
jgi:hypothetical protein